MVRQIGIAIMSAGICLISLLSGSGIGMAYGIYPKAMTLFCVLFVIFPLAQTVLQGVVQRRNLILFVGLAAIIGFWPMYQGYGTLGIEYGWLLLVPFVVGQIHISEQDARTIGLVCGGFACAVLIANLFLGMFGGWNRNIIAMMAFLGCAVCSASPWRTMMAKNIHRAFLLVMAFWVLRLDSRSCFFGILPLLCLFAFNIIKPSYVLKKRLIRRLLLITPALIAIGVVMFQNARIFDVLNDLSREYFGKPVFNGRNTIWDDGMNLWQANFWFGTGYINSGYWHNVAVTALTAFGLVGYLLWIGLFDHIMEQASHWKNDDVLSGCTVAFLSIMLQQSFELGMISTLGSMLPYLLLGIMLGRMRYLQYGPPEKKPL